MKNLKKSNQPPSILPDGRRNPEYRKWRRANGLEDPRKWNNSKRGQEAMARYRKSEKGREAKRKYQNTHETPEQYAERIMNRLQNVDLY